MMLLRTGLILLEIVELGDNFEHDITKGYRAKISWEGGLIVLGDEADEGIIIRFRAVPFVEDSVSNVTTYRVPIRLKKLST
jgi:hypothetical protein